MKNLLISLSILILGLMLIAPASLPAAGTPEITHPGALPHGKTYEPTSRPHQTAIPLSDQFNYVFSPSPASSSQSPTINVNKGVNSDTIQTGLALSSKSYNYNFITKDITVIDKGTIQHYSPSTNKGAWTSIARRIIALNNQATKEGNLVNANFGASPALGQKDAKAAKQMISSYTKSLEDAMNTPRRTPK